MTESVRKDQANWRCPDHPVVANAIARCLHVWMTKPIVCRIRWLNGERVVHRCAKATC